MPENETTDMGKNGTDDGMNGGKGPLIRATLAFVLLFAAVVLLALGTDDRSPFYRYLGSGCFLAAVLVLGPLFGGNLR